MNEDGRVPVMANLSIKDFPEELLREGRIEALASGQTFRAWMIDVFEQVCGQQEPQRQTTLQRHNGLVSSKRQRRVSGPHGAKFVDQKCPLPHLEAPSSPHERIKPCSHGLLFHPGCND